MMSSNLPEEVVSVYHQSLPANRHHLFFSPQLVKHLLDLQFPVVLQRVEGLGRHLEEARLLDGREMVQNGAEAGPAVRV